MSTYTGNRQRSIRATPPSSTGSGLFVAVPRVARRIVTATGTREVALLAGLWIFYTFSRLVADDNLAVARGRAANIIHLEGLLHLDVEASVNWAVAPIAGIAVPMSFWYATLHYLVTPAVLAFLFFLHRPDYSRARNALVIGSTIGLVCYLLLPTAPPRLMPGGHYLDALAMTSGPGWWGGDASAPASLGHITNELAAMPSLHVGWTVWVAWAVWRHANLLGRAIACLYVAGTTFVVIATGNHWVLDAVAGAVVVAAGIAISGRLAALRPEHAPATP